MLIFELLIIFALVLINAVFAGAEIAVVASRRVRLQQLASDGNRAAEAVLFLRHHPDRFFATVQVGITVVGATAGAFGGARFAEHIEPYLRVVAGRHAEGLSVALVVVLVSYLSVVIGELVPKSLALKYAESYALLIGRPLVLLSNIARPIVWFLTLNSNALLKPFGDRTTFGETKFSAEELQELLGEAGESGTVAAQVGEMAVRTFELEGLRARDVMVPRNSVCAVALDAPWDEVRRTMVENGHSRLPVYRTTIDDIVGYLVVKDTLGLDLDQEQAELKQLIRPAYFVPEGMLAREILREFQRRRVQLAIVIDEHGGMSGIITAEDIVEEIVGELFSEDDAPEAMIEREEAGALVLGRLPVREANRALGLALPESSEWNTVAGLCLYLAGGVPRKGTRLEVEGVATLEIVDASPRHVRQVRVQPV